MIDGIAARLGKKARIALRINPNVDAHTHHYITTGIEENKFGIYLYDLEHVITEVAKLKQIELIGLHFHIGSQITDMTVFRGLCIRANEIQRQMKERGLLLPHINFGGGLGIDYNEPYEKPIADFQSYFATFARFFEPEPHQQIHFELGRSIVAHCGDLISKVLYVKEGKNRKFVILDAGMNDLLRPALYQAFHKIENISSDRPEEKYDVVGPICESAVPTAKQWLPAIICAICPVVFFNTQSDQRNFVFQWSLYTKRLISTEILRFSHHPILSGFFFEPSAGFAIDSRICVSASIFFMR